MDEDHDYDEMSVDEESEPEIDGSNHCLLE